MGDEWNRANCSRTGLFEAGLAEEGLEDHPRPCGSSNRAGRPLSALTASRAFCGGGAWGPAASSDRLTGDWQQEQPLGVRAPTAPFCLL